MKNVKIRKSKRNKLSIQRTTVRNLGQGQLKAAAGGTSIILQTAGGMCLPNTAFCPTNDPGCWETNAGTSCICTF